MRMFTQTVTLLLVLAALLLGLAGAGCRQKGASGKPSNVDYYTCTMHPSVKSQDPNGKCPICSMDLVPVMKRAGGGASPTPAATTSQSSAKGDEMKGMQGMPGMKPGGQTQGAQTREFAVPVERQQQIGVTYAKVKREPLRHTIRSVGMVVPDKARNWQFVSRVDGYVQTLNVTAPGEIVDRGAPLLSIYSPDLLTSEREFVELLRMRDEAKSKDARETPSRLINSAKESLHLW